MRRLTALVIGFGLGLTGCAGEDSTGPELPSGAVAPDAATTTPALSDPAAEEVSLDGLSPRGALDVVRQQVAEAGSARLAVGNLNPPPTTFLEQDWSTQEGDLELRVELAPDRPVLALRRLDGQLLLSEEGGSFEPVPAPEVSEDDTSLVGRVLRTTPGEELDVLLADPQQARRMTGGVSEVDDAVAAYRFVVAVDRLAQAELDPFASLPWRGLPDRLPISLWVGADGLPLRLEARYSDPLNGIEGTGTVRIDYSAWGEPVELASP